MKKLALFLLPLTVWGIFALSTTIQGQQPFLIYGSGPGGVPRVVAVDAMGNLQTTASLSGDVTIDINQYTEGATDASITGTAMLGEGPGNTLTPIALDVNGGLFVTDNSAGVLLGTISSTLSSGIQVNCVTGCGGTSMVDDAVFTIGTTAIVPIGGTYKTTRDALNDNDGGALAISATRALYTVLETPLGDSAMDDTFNAVVVYPAGGSMAVTATVTFLGTGASAGWKSEDAASANADALIGIAAIRDDTLDARSGTEGDYEPLHTNANGALWTSDVNLKVEVVAAADGGAGFAIFARRTDTVASSSGTDGDLSYLTTDASGRLWVNCSTGCAGGTQFAEDLAHTTADVGTFALVIRRDTTPTSSSGTAGDYSAMNVDANGRLYVNSVLYDAAGAALTLASDSTLDAAIGTSGPMVTGRGSTATPTAMSTDNDTTALWLDLNGRIHEAAEGVEDVAETAASFLMRVGTVRRDAAASSAGTDGDNATLNTDASGRLWVNCGTGCSGGTQFAEDLAAISADVGTIALAVRRDTAASSSGTDGDYSTLNVNATGRLYTSTTVDAALPTGANTIGAVNIAAAQTLATVTTVSTLTTLSQLGGVALPIEDAAETAAGVGIYAMGVRRDVAASSAGTTGDNTMFSFDSVGAVWTRTTDPCSGPKTLIAVSQTTGTQLFTGTASNRTYVCHIDLVTATAQNIALVSGTGTVCATSIGPMMGGTTAATGWNFAANGGISAGIGTGTVAKSDTDADNICILQSGAGQLSGVISYVVAPN